MKITVEEFTTALSIFLGRNLHPTHITLLPAEPYPFEESETVRSMGKWVPTALDITDSLGKDFFPFLIGFNNLRKSPGFDPFRFSIKKLTIAMEEDDPSVRISEALTGLEALFTGKEEEVTYRTAIRCAVFLGKDLSDRNIIFEGIKEGYVYLNSLYRCEMLEEVSVVGRSFSAEDLARLLQKYLSESLKYRILLGRNYPKFQMLSIIDRKIVEQDLNPLIPELLEKGEKEKAGKKEKTERETA